MYRFDKILNQIIHLQHTGLHDHALCCPYIIIALISMIESGYCNSLVSLYLIYKSRGEVL